ncbi:hypothetical protein HAP47_0001320 [Bradyrhizobium sp. 41S5]|uniref:hypothetical protein n=1 Tax=Bradyrhizobium sp. 41S5 TaxID=1404443 RepID=UPI00156B76E1|nr:hypothetical protein [Bradyrhizobium sp. 41S5]UFX45403.1 hypothetical protein HAP47_0001320 [Bradyrhizobium sp. 41S5]
MLARFRAKWTPVRVKKTRLRQKVEHIGPDLIRTDMLQAAFTLVSEALERYPDHSHIGW